jgi:dynein heavy chain
MGCLLERSIIKRDFEPKYAVIVKFLEEEMDVTKRIFDKHIRTRVINRLKPESSTSSTGSRRSRLFNKSIQVHRNMPDIAGLLKWCNELRERIQRPMQIFDKLIDHPIKDSIEVSRIRKKYAELLQLLSQFAVGPYENWCKSVGNVCQFNLEKNLIFRDSKTRVIKNNFDSELISVIREVKYLELLKGVKVPPEALDLFEKYSEYSNHIISLNYTVDSYNRMFKISTKEELVLISDELGKIDLKLEIGISQLQWKTTGISEYIIKIRKKVTDLESRLQKTKSNIEKITSTMNTWNDNPLFKRHETKITLLQLDDKQSRLNNRYKEIEDSGKKIHKLINVKILFNKDSPFIHLLILG